MQADKKTERALIIVSFVLAGVVGGLYAVGFLNAGRKIHSAVVARKISDKVEDFLKGLG